MTSVGGDTPAATLSSLQQMKQGLTGLLAQPRYRLRLLAAGGPIGTAAQGPDASNRTSAIPAV
ncbi:MAG: hypothetical protein ABI748_09705 [Dokdonella sp.]